MPTEYRGEIEQLQLVRDLGYGISGQVKLYRIPDSSYRAVKWFRTRGDAEREGSILEELGSKRELSDYIVTSYGLVYDPRKVGPSGSVGLVLEALVPETQFHHLSHMTLHASPIKSLSYVEKLADAISALHRSGYSQGDIRGNALFVQDAEGLEVRLKMIDFSLAQYKNPNSTVSDLMRVTNIVSDIFEGLAERVKPLGIDPKPIRDIMYSSLPSSHAYAIHSPKAPTTEEWHRIVTDASQRVKDYIITHSHVTSRPAQITAHHLQTPTFDGSVFARGDWLSGFSASHYDGHRILFDFLFDLQDSPDNEDKIFGDYLTAFLTDEVRGLGNHDAALRSIEDKLFLPD